MLEALWVALFGYDIFITYTREDGEEYARALKEALDREYLVFIDYSSIPVCGPLKDVIRREIRRCKLHVVVLTPKSVDRNKAPWVLKEVEWHFQIRRQPRIFTIFFSPNSPKEKLPDGFERLADYKGMQESLGAEKDSNILATIANGKSLTTVLPENKLLEKVNLLVTDEIRGGFSAIRHRAWMQVGLAITAAIIIFMTGAYWSNELSKERAERAAKAQALVAESNSEKDQYPIRAIILSEEAIKTLQRQDDKIEPQIEQPLLDLLNTYGGQGVANDQSGITGLGFNTSSTLLATSNGDCTIQLWKLTDSGTRYPLPAINTPTAITKMSLYSDGSLIAGLKDGTVYIWQIDDTGNVQPKNHSSATQSPIADFAYNPKCSILAWGHDDGTISACDLKNGFSKEVSLDGYKSNIVGYSVGHTVISNDGRWLVVTAKFGHGEVHVFDLSRGIESINNSLYRLPHPGLHSCVAFDSTVRWLIVAGEGGEDHDSRLDFYDLTSPKSDGPNVVFSFPSEVGDVASISINEDNIMAIAGSKGLSLLALKKISKNSIPVKITDPAFSPLQIVEFSKNGRWLAAVNDLGGRDVILCPFKSGGVGRQFYKLQGQGAPIDSLDFSPDDQWLITAASSESKSNLVEDQGARLWHLFPEELGRPITGLPIFRLTNLQSSIMTPDHKKLLCLTSDRNAELWDISTSYPVHLARLFNNQSITNLISITNDCKTIVAVESTKDGDRLGISGNFGQDFDQSLPSIGDASLHEAKLSPNGKWLAGIDDEGRNYLWSVNGSTFSAISLPPQPAYGMIFHDDLTFNEDGSWLIVSRNETATAFDLKAEPVRSVELQGHQNEITAIKFSHDGKWLATGDNSGKLILRSGEDWQNSKELPGLKIRSLAFSLDGHWLASGGEDLYIYLRDLGNLSKKPFILGRHDGPISALAFSDDSSSLFSGSPDKTVRQWEIEGSNPSFSRPLILRNEETAATDLAFDATRKQLVAVSWDGTNCQATVWDLELDHLLARGQNVAGRNLTPLEWSEYFPNQQYTKTFPEFPPIISEK